jgi:hypothetical protein
MLEIRTTSDPATIFAQRSLNAQNTWTVGKVSARLSRFWVRSDGRNYLPDAGWGWRQGKITTERIDLRRLGVYSSASGSKNGNPGSAMRRAIATLLVLMVAGNLPVGYGAQASAQPQRSPSASDIKDQVSQIPVGAFVEVRFTDKTKLRGYLSAVEADGFSFKTGDSATGTLRQTAFGDVKSVKVVKRTHTPVGAWIAMAAIVAAVVIVVAIFAVERHNELGS